MKEETESSKYTTYGEKHDKTVPQTAVTSTLGDKLTNTGCTGGILWPTSHTQIVLTKHPLYIQVGAKVGL